jgi:hypothetical protein
LTTVWTLWFTGAFAPYMATLPAWVDAATWARNFDPAPYVAWVLPCLFLSLTFPALLAAVHLATPAERRVWSLLGLAFGIMYGAVLSMNYWLLATVVRGSLQAGYVDGLDRFIIGNPYSITNAIEGIGYGFMGLAALFAGFAIGGRSRWVGRVLIINGLAGIGGVIGGGLGNMPSTMVSLAVWCVSFPVATILLARWFRQLADGTKKNTMARTA